MISVISFEYHISCMKPSGMSRKFIPSSIRAKTFYCLNIAIYIMPTKLEENL